MTTTFVTEKQKEHLEAALQLTGSEGFMQDAYALAVYSPGKDGNADEIRAIAVFECFRAGSAEMHLGTVPGARLGRDMIAGFVQVAFHPKLWNLTRLKARVPIYNVEMQCALLKMGAEFQYRDPASTVGGWDGIVFTLDRAKLIENTKAAAGADHHNAQTGE